MSTTNRVPSTKYHKVALDWGNTTPNDQQKAQAWQDRMSHVFATDNLELRDTDVVKLLYRRVPPGKPKELIKSVQDTLAAGIIKESESPNASVVLVRKKDTGAHCGCVDSRKQNCKTVKDSYAIPHVAETLSGAQWFCSLYLQSGYSTWKSYSRRRIKWRWPWQHLWAVRFSSNALWVNQCPSNF